MEVEEAFGIEIVDGEKTETPGHLIDLIFSKIGREPGRLVLPGLRAFYAFRKACLESGIGSRSEIKPTASLESLFPRRTRVRDWYRVGEIWGLKPWPDLRRPGALVLAVILLTLMPIIGWALTMAPEGRVLPLSFALWLTLLFLGTLLTRPFRNRFPKELNTVRDVVMHCLSYQPAIFLRNSESLNRQSIAVIVKRIVCRYCDPKDYREGAHFIRDLGLD
ncbi:MAG: hypothetical protein KDN20_06780 [Verrucomicrobiae bacterium]|nr:hypothetical protein [Verrucomicrobiae bacterium]